jgi:DNA invertase Pin-like site-specific DNA recombinase
VTELHSRGVGFKSLQENIDTTTSDEVQLLNNMASDKSLTVSDICKTLGIGRTTFYRYVKARERE